jgi:hypothetical protein
MDEIEIQDFFPARLCAKCGAGDARMVFCAQSECGRYSHYRLAVTEEHLCRFCERCSYRWVERTREQQAAFDAVPGRGEK